jgi:hypothetical protein
MPFLQARLTRLRAGAVLAVEMAAERSDLGELHSVNACQETTCNIGKIFRMLAWSLLCLSLSV